MFIFYTIKSSSLEDIHITFNSIPDKLLGDDFAFFAIFNGCRPTEEESLILSHPFVRTILLPDRLTLPSAIQAFLESISSLPFRYISRIDPGDSIFLKNDFRDILSYRFDIGLVDYVSSSAPSTITTRLDHHQLIVSEEFGNLISEPHGAGTILSSEFIQRLPSFPIQMSRNDGYWLFLNSFDSVVLKVHSYEYNYIRSISSLSSSRNEVVSARIYACKAICELYDFASHTYPVVIIVRQNTISETLCLSSMLPPIISELVYSSNEYSSFSSFSPKLYPCIFTDSLNVASKFPHCTQYISSEDLSSTPKLVTREFPSQLIIYYNLEYPLSVLSDIYLCLIPLLLAPSFKSSVLAHEDCSLLSQVYSSDIHILRSLVKSLVQMSRYSGIICLRTQSSPNQFIDNLLSSETLIGLGSIDSELRLQSSTTYQTLLRFFKDL